MSVFNISSFHCVVSDDRPQLAFVDKLSKDSSNTVFALVRKLETSQRVAALNRPNVHIFQADISNVSELKVSVFNSSHEALFDNALRALRLPLKRSRKLLAESWMS